MSLDKNRLLELIAEAKKREAERKQQAANPAPVPTHHHKTAEEIVAAAVTAADPNAFEWNEEQQRAIDLAVTRKSFCLIGAAGTGKTTTEREIVRRLIAENVAVPLSMSTKYLKHGVPGIVLTSFTRRAVRNMRKVVSEEMKEHCITLHKLLEYEPVYYEVWDNETQKYKNTMRFEPMRNKECRLPNELTTVIIDESSMVSTDLFQKLLEALASVQNTQFIFVGDLHQLPPVYGQAILGFKLLDLPTIELTKIYRQAQKSPIITLAHKIKNGEDIHQSSENVKIATEQGTVTIRPWKKPLSDFDATLTASAFLKKLVAEGDYNEEEDIILCPQEKTKNLAFGTNEFNRIIAQALGDKRDADVYEVIAGYEKHYLAVGDRLLVGREDAVVTAIVKNSKYWGKRPKQHSPNLDRWGSYKAKVEADSDDADFDVDKYLENFSLEGQDKDDDRKQEASHVVTVELLDSGATENLTTAGEINATQFAYALTVHKSQGSEWNRVFFLTHQSHVIMWNRELLYTAVTRARQELYIICEPDRPGRRGTLWKAAKSPRIKGDTLAEKAEFFKGKQEEYQNKYKQDFSDADSGRRIYKETPKESAPTPTIPPAPPVHLVKMHEFVSEAFKKKASESLRTFWNKALAIWGFGKIGPLPTIDYNLQRHSVVGLARLQLQQIALNPVWCIMAEKDPAVAHEMLHETIGHEVAHLVAWNYSKDRGHDSGWIMTMKLLGLTPDVFLNDKDLPNWAKQYKELMQKTLEELKATKNADTSEDSTGFNSYDEV